MKSIILILFMINVVIFLLGIIATDGHYIGLVNFIKMTLMYFNTFGKICGFILLIPTYIMYVIVNLILSVLWFLFCWSPSKKDKSKNKESQS